MQPWLTWAARATVSGVGHAGVWSLAGYFRFDAIFSFLEANGAVWINMAIGGTKAVLQLQR